MLRSMNDLKEYSIRAIDGNIGHVKDLYFDDIGWVIRYLVVDTGNWLMERKVLISPISIKKSHWADKSLAVGITIEQVKNSPEIDVDKPVSRQHENDYLGYFGYRPYWGGAGLWDAGSFPRDMVLRDSPTNISRSMLATDIGMENLDADQADPQTNDSHLRSCEIVIGYHIHATDGDIGHISGMLFDEQTWAIRYFIVDTSNWWFGHKVLIAPQWIEEVRWLDSSVTINMSRQAIQDARPYDTTATLDRKHEVDIHQHYGRAGYWELEGKDKDS